MSISRKEGRVFWTKGPEDFKKVKYKGVEVPLLDIRVSGNRPKDIDPKIRDLVLELNMRGFETWSSCEGHRAGSQKHGWVTFTAELDSEEQKEVKKVASSLQVFQRAEEALQGRGL